MFIIDTLLTVFFGILGLGIIVFIHELGHFIAAKLCKIEVETFSLGWGKKIAGFKYKGTNYQISRFPIGGYCKMKGEYLKEQLDDEAAEKLREDKGSFIGAAPWKRAVVAVAGPGFNLIFAVLIYFIIFLIGFQVASQDSRIILLSDYFDEPAYMESPATVYGLKTGDLVVSIDEKKVDSFWHLADVITNNPDKELNFNIIRENSEMSIKVKPDNINGEGKIGIHIWIEPVIDTIEPGSYASLAGLLPGDRIISANNEKILNSLDLDKILLNKPAQLDLLIDRGGITRNITLPVEYDMNSSPSLGFTYAYNFYKSFSLSIPEAFVKGLFNTGNFIKLTVIGIIDLFRNNSQDINEVVAGPIRITQIVGETATNSFKNGIGEGFSSFFILLSYLSIAIALMNLLPVPALDGGTIIISLFEQVRRKPLKIKNIFRFQIIGFLFIAVLIVVAVFSDFMYIIKNIFS